MDLEEIEWEQVGWIYQAQNRDQWPVLVNMIINL
jgi:hypothetical protein